MWFMLFCIQLVLSSELGLLAITASLQQAKIIIDLCSILIFTLTVLKDPTSQNWIKCVRTIILSAMPTGVLYRCSGDSLVE